MLFGFLFIAKFISLVCRSKIIIMLIKLILLALLVININVESTNAEYKCAPLSYRLGYVFANYVSYKSRYRIKYFSGRALYYSNTMASYCTSSVIRDMSGDVEKNPGPNECRSNDQEVCNTSWKRPASEMSTDETNPYDIGLIRFPNARQLSNGQKYDFILRCWKLEPSYNFPTILEGKNNRAFGYEWLRTYPWLRHSPMYDGGFCLPYVLFGNDTMFERLDKLFKSPLKL